MGAEMELDTKNSVSASVVALSDFKEPAKLELNVKQAGTAIETQPIVLDDKEPTPTSSPTLLPMETEETEVVVPPSTKKPKLSPEKPNRSAVKLDKFAVSLAEVESPATKAPKTAKASRSPVKKDAIVIDGPSFDKAKKVVIDENNEAKAKKAVVNEGIADKARKTAVVIDESTFEKAFEASKSGSSTPIVKYGPGSFETTVRPLPVGAEGCLDVSFMALAIVSFVGFCRASFP
jgi:hypothetical protein